MARPINLIVMFREGMVNPFTSPWSFSFLVQFLFFWPVLITSLFLWISLLSPLFSPTLYSLVTLSQLSLFHKLFIRPFFLVFFIFNFYFTINTTNDPTMKVILLTFQTVKRETFYNMLMLTLKNKKPQLSASPKL